MQYQKFGSVIDAVVDPDGLFLPRADVLCDQESVYHLHVCVCVHVRTNILSELVTFISGDNNNNNNNNEKNRKEVKKDSKKNEEGGREIDRQKLNNTF